MLFLVLFAWLRLFQFDLYLFRRNYNAMTKKARNYPVANRTATAATIKRLCYAMDMASIWYFKEVLCLQRSAATTCFLRSFGVPAKMIEGSQMVPFKSHAWVEVNGEVVSDKPYMREMYAVLSEAEI